MKECHPRFRGWDSPYRRLVESLIGVNRAHRMVLERQLNKTGVYRSQHQLLMYIAHNPNVSQKELAALHHVSTATVAVSLKKLENGGYVRRVVDKNDNRYNQICITEKGKTIVDGSIRYFQELEIQMFDGFSEEELHQLQEFGDRISRNLEQVLLETEREE